MTQETERLREVVAAELTRARARTTTLTETVDDADLTRQHSPLMSPLVWDLAHVGNQEELWLVRDVGGRDPLRHDLDELYDAFKHPRRNRPALPLLNPAEARAYVAGVRDKALDVLDTVRLDERRLVADGFAFGMIVQHEQQHDETMLATHQLRGGAPVLAAPPPPPARAPVDGEVLIGGGPFVMGTDTEPWALDNERPAHTVEVAAFAIDAAPVTNARYAQFIAAGGYDDPRWWSAPGWAHRQAVGLQAPMHWRRDGDGWAYTRFGRLEPVAPDEPVVHVCFYEAQAYAAWAGRRLPTEAEWEKGARGTDGRAYPWGDEEDEGRAAVGAGLKQGSTSPAGSLPDGASPYGLLDMAGNVWEWTSTEYPPGERVLRGGSFASPGLAWARCTMRSHSRPVRRQSHIGFRVARGAA
jgi:iron(II)-dependent oxidoreductase